MNQRVIRFGVIGCGLMGREFAACAARWGVLSGAPARPEIVAVCNRSEAPFAWFRQAVPTIRQFTQDYRQLLANPDVDAVYVAVPHHLHQAVYVDTIRAGKHLMGEKPFGIDLPANQAICAEIERHPNVFVRCVSQFPFFPAAQRIGKMIEAGAFGRIIEVQTGLLHSSDLNPDKPINWKRQAQFNGRYGVMGDLGMHACHLPLRAGWEPLEVRAVLSDIVRDRPDGKGGRTPCDTWDNATLLIRTRDPRDGAVFPWTLRTARIAPGQRNTWYVEILGTRACARFSTANPRLLEVLEYTGGDQDWRQVQTGFETAYPTITGAIFEFGFADALQQMWAAYLHELATETVPYGFAGCVRPGETTVSHRLFTQALTSAS